MTRAHKDRRRPQIGLLAQTLRHDQPTSPRVHGHSQQAGPSDGLEVLTWGLVLGRSEPLWDVQGLDDLGLLS